MEIINKSDEKLLAEYEQFASTSKYGNFMQSLKWPKVKDNWGWDAVISRDADGNIRGTCLIIIKKCLSSVLLLCMPLMALFATGLIKRS